MNSKMLKRTCTMSVLVLLIILLIVLVVARLNHVSAEAAHTVVETVVDKPEAPPVVPEPEPIPEPEPEPEPLVVEVKHITSLPYYDVPLDEELQFFIAAECEKHHIDPSVVVAMIDVESKYTVDIMGDGGNAFGLMQIHPRWHGDRMERLMATNLLDPYQNVLVGIDFLRELSESGKPIEWVLMAYNGGMQYANEMRAAGKVSFYASEVLRISNELKEGEKMAVFITDDPIADFNAWDAEQADWLAKLPVCADCDEPIQDETAFYINGDWICNDCIDSYKRDVLPE